MTKAAMTIIEALPDVDPDPKSHGPTFRIAD
jgi:hypothetical protein